MKQKVLLAALSALIAVISFPPQSLAKWMIFLGMTVVSCGSLWSVFRDLMRRQKD